MSSTTGHSGRRGAGAPSVPKLASAHVGKREIGEDEAINHRPDFETFSAAKPDPFFLN
jgi:hypothetical protein